MDKFIEKMLVAVGFFGVASTALVYLLHSCARAQHHKLRNDEYERVPFTHASRFSFGKKVLSFNGDERALLLPLTAIGVRGGLGVFAQ